MRGPTIHGHREDASGAWVEGPSQLARQVAGFLFYAAVAGVMLGARAGGDSAWGYAPAGFNSRPSAYGSG